MSILSGKSKNFKIIFAVMVFIVAASLVFGGVFAYYAVNAATSDIYSGIKIGDLDIGGMDEKSAEKLIREKYGKYEFEKFTLNCNGTVFDIYSSGIFLKADYKATAVNAASFGKEGSVLNRIKNMRKISKNGESLNLVFSCDVDALQYIINEKMGESLVAVQQYSVEIDESEIIVSNGTPGKVVSAPEVIKLISQKVTEGRGDEIIDVAIEDRYPEKIEFENFYMEYNRKAENARVETNGDEITIIPEIVGIELDEETARRIIGENINSSRKYSIPANITYPEVTAKDLEEEFIDTIIATYSTNYSTSSANRKENIRLASEKLNGFVLNPGEVFSFNDAVGPRTAERGYKVAQGYMGTKVVDDIGGGICQVSSTLYNAVVLADMEIVFRTNHTMPVSYTPLGRDATVSYGAVDFKFKNNKETPVKFEFISDGSTLTVNVYGRKKYIKDISIESEITGYIPFSVTEIQDDTMYVGETKVESAGANGTSVKTYKVVKENGSVVSRTPLANSNYIPTSRVVRIGTMPKEDTGVSSDGMSGTGSVSSDAQVPSEDIQTNPEQTDIAPEEQQTTPEETNTAPDESAANTSDTFDSSEHQPQVTQPDVTTEQPYTPPAQQPTVPAQGETNVTNVDTNTVPAETTSDGIY